MLQDVIKDWIEALTLERGVVYANTKYANKPRFGLPPGLKYIECGPSICALTKCYQDDERCNFIPGVDSALLTYSQAGTNKMEAG